MRILQVLAGAPHGGAETAFTDMCIAMHEAGQTIEVVTRPNDIRVPHLRQAGLKVHTLRFGGKWDVFTTLALKRIIYTFKPDIVQSWMSRASSKLPRWHKNMPVPEYLTVARLGGYYKLKYFKPVQYFTTITPDIRRYLIDNGIPPENIRHINNFAETETEFTPLSRAEYGVPDNGFLLLALGRLHPSKAFDTLIKSMEGTDNVYLWIAGEGPERTALESLIETLGLPDKIKLLGWRSDRAALFHAADACVFPSRYEPFGTVFVQAWANKTPLIATMADGARQFVTDNSDGLLTPIDDIPALRHAIQTLQTDGALSEKLVRNGFLHYQNAFTKEKTVQAYLDYYAELRARHGL